MTVFADYSKEYFVGRPSFYTHKEECDAVSMRRGACALNRRPSQHGKAKESSPQEEKGCSKEEEEVVSSSLRYRPARVCIFLYKNPGLIGPGHYCLLSREVYAATRPAETAALRCTPWSLQEAVVSGFLLPQSSPRGPSFSREKERR